MIVMYIQLLRKLPVLLVVLLVAGCRTYGGYDTEQASYDQILVINTQFKQDLERAKSQLDVLTRAASSDNELREAVDQYKELLAKHEEMIANHEEITASLKVKTGALGRLSTSYRDLNRALGAITTEQLGMQKRYEEFAISLLDDARQAHVQKEEGRYQIAPPFYEQIRFALAERSISGALDERADS